MNFKKLLSKYDKIVIPCLQRDYAQGRTERKATEIREDLLYEIFSKEGISLNVVFGETDGQTFLPIDGQQRLTTLFLLYLYNLKFNGVVTENLRKFSYETRHSTIDFLKELVERDWNVESIKRNLSEQPVSDFIKDQSWYVWPWNLDPTVMGMLTMLDSIHRFANRFVFPDLDKITFDFLDMGELGLNETLYLKMNSRGRHLNSFEKIKSGLDGLAETATGITPESVVPEKSGITSKIKTFAGIWRWEMDRSWSDYFWNPDTCTQDDQFLNFIKAYSIAFYINERKLHQNDRYEYIRDPKLSLLEASEISWSSLKSILEIEIDNKPILDPSLIEKYFYGLARLLNRIVKVDNFATSWGTTVFMQDKDYDNKKIALIWALTKYSEKSFSGESFQQWIRFLFNMIHNTIDDFNTLVRFIYKVSDYYCTHSANIIEWLSAEESKDIDDKTDQWEEERCKAKALNNKDKCTEIILKAEAHPLFEGRIRPLLYNESTEGLTTESLEKRWYNFDIKFNNTGAKGDTALETFRTLFSFCDIYGQLWWDKYVFQNTKEVWKDRIFKLKAFNWAVVHLLNGDDPNKLVLSVDDPNKRTYENPISVLCHDEVLKKVLDTDGDWYIRHPDMSLRPYGNMWSGIRLTQSNVLASVRNLLSVNGINFKESDYSDFYKITGLVWGVRISFIYKNKEIQLWDDCKLWLGYEYLKDTNGNELRMYEISSSEIKILLDKYLTVL